MVTKAAKNKDIKVTNFEELYNTTLKELQIMQRDFVKLQETNNMLKNTLVDKSVIIDAKTDVTGRLVNLEGTYNDIVKAVATLQGKHAALEGLVQNIVRNKIKPQTSNQESALEERDIYGGLTQPVRSRWGECLTYFNLNSEIHPDEQFPTVWPKFLMALIVMSHYETKIDVIRLSFLIGEISPKLPQVFTTFFISVSDNIPKESFRGFLNLSKVQSSKYYATAAEDAKQFIQRHVYL